MSLNTLLKAAEFLELSSERSPRENSSTRGQHAVVFNIDRRRVVSESDALDRRRRPGGAGTRETHNKLEKNRRAHLKECFDVLKREVPTLEDKKTSNLNILRSALKHIQILKKQEREYENEYGQLKLSNRAKRERADALKQFLIAERKLPPNLEVSKVKPIGDAKPPSTCTTATAASCPVSVSTQTPPSPSKEGVKCITSVSSECNGAVSTCTNDSGIEENHAASDNDTKTYYNEWSKLEDNDDEKTDTDEGLSHSEDERDIEIDVVGQDDVGILENNHVKMVEEPESQVDKDQCDTVLKGWSTTPYANAGRRKRSRSADKREEDSDYDGDTKEEPKTKIQACARVSS
ncbi:uncharacterized protein LOC5516612 [Nematostella vectensis]|uniref:uncharacterized protein LOC5516612 n=1 Tax=Nematostella vectensis TaxID=45351 RepID=UPI00138FF198|nr:uncharacterized protein LOC5516612 [Nematostella vectensis]